MIAEPTVSARPVYKADPNRLLYLGGPVDYANHDVATDWRHWPEWEELGLEPYCPKCRCEGLNDDEIIAQNRWALFGAQYAILDLRGYSIGTPIEMYWRCWEVQRPAILIAKDGSVFIRSTVNHYPARVVGSEAQALEAMRLLVY